MKTLNKTMVLASVFAFLFISAGVASALTSGLTDYGDSPAMTNQQVKSGESMYHSGNDSPISDKELGIGEYKEEG